MSFSPFNPAGWPCKGRLGAVALFALASSLSACAEGSMSSYTQGPLSLASGEEESVALADAGDFNEGVPSYVAVSGNALLPVNAVAPLVPAALAGAAQSLTTSPALTGNGLASLGTNGLNAAGNAGPAALSVGVTAGPGSVAATANAGPVALGLGVGPGLNAAANTNLAGLSGGLAVTGGAGALGAGVNAGPTAVGASLSPTTVATVQVGVGTATAAVTAGAVPTVNSGGTAAAATPAVSLATQGSILSGASSAVTGTVGAATNPSANPLIVTASLLGQKVCNPKLMKC